MDIVGLILALAILPPLVVALSEFFSKYTHANGIWARIQSWVVSVGLLLGADYFDATKEFAGFAWYYKVLMGIFVGLIANGYFSIDAIKDLLVILKLRTVVPAKV